MLSKTRCSIGSKKTVFNLLIKGGPAPQKCYARVWPGHRVVLRLTKLFWQIKILLKDKYVFYHFNVIETNMGTGYGKEFWYFPKAKIQISGTPGQISGYTCQISGNTDQISGNTCQISGNPARISGILAKFQAFWPNFRWLQPNSS